MATITDHAAFQQALASMPLAQQRQVGARFIERLLQPSAQLHLDSGSEARLERTCEVASQPDPDPAELNDAYQAVHALYVNTHPRSDLAPLDYSKQALHFIAEACLCCLSPTYPEAKVHHLAEKVAMYCRMARVCASIPHEQATPDLSGAEQAMQQEIQAQFAIVNDLLAP
jgi:hypothetical protein